MPRPLYAPYAHSSPAFDPRTLHAGLWYDKFCDQWQDDWTLPADKKVQWMRKLANGTPVGDATLLGQFAARQKKIVEGLGGKCLAFRAESRFVTGLGREHPVENGFAWHPTLGTPYLPGSSIKGVVRAWAVMDGKKDVADKILGCQESPAGADAQAGAVILFDAVPLGPVKLEVDVMTPHYGEYYGSGETPGDWLNPVPIPFLVVAAGTSFQFAVAPRILDGKEHLESVAEWLKNALQWLGAGAKTAVGYGRFELGEGKTGEASPAAARQQVVRAAPRPAQNPEKVAVKVLERRDVAGKPQFFVREEGKPRGVLAYGVLPPPEKLPQVGDEIDVYRNNQDPRSPQYRWDKPEDKSQRNTRRGGRGQRPGGRR